MKHTLQQAAYLMLSGSLVFAMACNDGNDAGTGTDDSTGQAMNNTNTTTEPTAGTNTTGTGDSGMGMNNSTDPGISDQDFVNRATMNNIAEIAAHQAAVGGKATTAEVKKHAQMMLTDHKKMGEDMQALARKKNMNLPTDAPADKKQMLEAMNRDKKGKDWDMAYIDQQIADHKETISLFEQGEGSVQDAELKSLITATLPKLRSHLQMVEEAKGKM